MPAPLSPLIAAAPLRALVDRLSARIAATPPWEQGGGSHRAMTHLVEELEAALVEAGVQPVLLDTAAAGATVGRGAEDIAYHCRAGHFPNARKVGLEWFIPREDLCQTFKGGRAARSAAGGPQLSGPRPRKRQHASA